uniref:uncharacterized protein LOC120333040 n=1 Tax=Styela clava TaxID=7725 RepID=UPI001939D57A|nr:uncharacterized protein LOC120333040 [Styela clava]
MSTKKLVSKEIKSSKDLEKIKKDLNKIKQPFFIKVIKLDRIEYPELNLLINLMKRNRLQEISVRECCETADDLARLLQAISSNPYVDTTPLSLDIRENQCDGRCVELLRDMIDRGIIASLELPSKQKENHIFTLLRSIRYCESQMQLLNINDNVIDEKSFELLMNILMENKVQKKLYLKDCRKPKEQFTEADKQSLQQAQSSKKLAIKWFKTKPAVNSSLIAYQDGNRLLRRVTDRLLSYVPESHREAAKLSISNQFRPKKKRNKNRYPVYQDDISSSEDQYCSEDEEMIDNCPTDSEDMDTSSAVDALTTPRFEEGYPIKNDIGKNNSRRWPMNYGEMYYTPLDDRQEKTFSRKSRAGIFTNNPVYPNSNQGEQYTNQQLHSSSKVQEEPNARYVHQQYSDYNQSEEYRRNQYVARTEFDAHERQFPGYRISSVSPDYRQEMSRIPPPTADYTVPPTVAYPSTDGPGPKRGTHRRRQTRERHHPLEDGHNRGRRETLMTMRFDVSNNDNG